MEGRASGCGWGWMGMQGCWSQGGWTREGKCPSLGLFIPVWLKKSSCDLLYYLHVQLSPPQVPQGLRGPYFWFGISKAAASIWGGGGKWICSKK